MNAHVELSGMKKAANVNHVKTKESAQRMNSSTPKLANVCVYLNAVQMACLGTTIFVAASTISALNKSLFVTGYKTKIIGSSPQDLPKIPNQPANR